METDARTRRIIPPPVTYPQQKTSLLHRSLKQEYPCVVRGEGALLWDSAGKQYVDLAGSAAVNFIGHGNAEVAEAIAEQARRLEFVHSSQFTSEPAEQLATQLVEWAGPVFAG